MYKMCVFCKFVPFVCPSRLLNNKHIQMNVFMPYPIISLCHSSPPPAGAKILLFLRALLVYKTVLDCYSYKYTFIFPRFLCIHICNKIYIWLFDNLLLKWKNCGALSNVIRILVFVCYIYR